MQVIPPAIKKILDNWNIRALVILSLLFQTSLIFLAPLRKRTWKSWLAATLWISYLLADWTANYAVSQITKNQGKELKPDDPPKNKKLLALWAPFLLLHLGGPDTITALALEDNALWQRHMFGLVSQALAGVYAVIQSLENVLWPPITLIFITGTIKYVERTVALYTASLENFKASMLQSADSGPNYAKLMEEYDSRKKSNLSTEIFDMDNPDNDMRPRKLARPVRDNDSLTDLEVVQYGFKLFDMFKGLIVDLIFSFRERDESRAFFKSLTPEDALRIIETELSFIYESMYTKTAILHWKTGTLFRAIAFISLVSSFYLFHSKPFKSSDVHGADVVITYVLYIVGIALDLASMVMFLLSDWTFAKWRKLKDDPDEEISSIDRLLNWYLGFKKPQWKEHKCHKKHHMVLSTSFFSRRWSGTIYGFNFIGYCLKAKVSRIHQKTNLWVYIWDFVVVFFDRVIREIKTWFRWIKSVNRTVTSVLRQQSTTNWMIRFIVNPLYLVVFVGIPKVFEKLWGYIDRIFSVTSYLDQIRFISREPLTKNQWEFIFDELKDKSDFVEKPELAKKVSSARGEWALRDTNSGQVDALKRYIENVDYDQSLLLWHIATELCFQIEEDHEIDKLSRESYDDREFSKIISDYMMYLLIMQPKLMSEVAGIGTIRFRDTLAEAERFFNGRHTKDLSDMKRASNTILSVRTNIEPILVKGDRSKSVLFDASMLAKELQKMKESKDEDGKWRVLRKVWIELLSYAASHCEATKHVAQLSRGGELLNFVWLLMAHFGLADQYQINKGEAGAKMVVRK